MEHLEQRENEALNFLWAYVPVQGYYGCFSGGKDSCVLKHLVKRSGVQTAWYYNVTTLDPPEVVYFIRQEHPDVSFIRVKHGKHMLTRVISQGFPTRKLRWCCREFKERTAPIGSYVLRGIRAEESARRTAIWKPVTEDSKHPETLYLHPILAWTEVDIWEYIDKYKVPYCSLYDEGFSRLGCIGCPNARRGKLHQFERWPGYERLWKRAFARLWDNKHGKLDRFGKTWFGDRYFNNWEDMWKWWLSDAVLPIERK